MTGGDRGFTLLELLVVLAITGLLLAALSGGMRFGLTAIAAEDRLTSHDEDLVTLDRVFRNLVSRATAGSEQAAMPFRGTGHTLGFTATFTHTAGPASSGAIDVSIGLDQQHRLVLTTQPHYTRASPGVSLGSVQVLAEGVSRLDIDYAGLPLDPAAWQSGWSDAELPALVRLHLVLRGTGKTRLPDIVAQTRLRTRPL